MEKEERDLKGMNETEAAEGRNGFWKKCICLIILVFISISMPACGSGGTKDSGMDLEGLLGQPEEMLKEAGFTEGDLLGYTMFDGGVVATCDAEKGNPQRH